MDMYKEPVKTKCGHAFCRGCMVHAVSSQKSPTCPLCNKPITRRSYTDDLNLHCLVDAMNDLCKAIHEDCGVLSK